VNAHAVLSDLKNELELIVETEAYRTPAGPFAANELALTQTAIVQKVLNLTASNDIDLSQSIGYYKPVAVESTANTCKSLETLYNPFGGGGTVPTSIPDPNVSDHATGVNLRYPYDTGATSTVILNRSPNFGDIQRFGGDRIQRESRGGSLSIYADPQWPKVQTLLYTISVVRPDKAAEVLTFLKTYLGLEIGLLTHEGQLWKGIVVNPEEAVVHDRRESYTVGIEFVGEEV
ncbi:MAG: hypothetical protein KDA84_24300, partial [Planctomycetaceae bacterium]|nr:hypothetical protein [Planctomycetaceae bacterium]